MQKGRWLRKKMPVYEFRSSSTNDAKFKFEASDTRQNAYFTFVDEDDIRKTFWNPSAGQIVVDVGACYGSYTLPALAAGAIVYAFEPKPEEFAALVQNILLNDGFCVRSQAFMCGLSNKEDEKMPFDTIRSSIQRRDDGDIGNFDSSIQVTTLDSVVRKGEIPRIDFLKIDVEGAELEVIEGARESIKKWRPYILVECHNFMRDGIDKEVSNTLLDIVPEYKMRVQPRENNRVHQSFFVLSKEEEEDQT
jgi:FkbM family methyltransferase